MKVLEILRNWRRRSDVGDKATFGEIEAASAALEAVERELGPGHTAIALDLAIEKEAIRGGETRQRRKDAMKKAIRGDE